MARFLAILDPQLKSAGTPTKQAAIALSFAHRWPGIAVYSDTPSLIAPDNQALLLGTVFSRAECPHPIRAIPAGLDEAQWRDWLLSKVWGAFVGFRHRPDGNLDIYRDPSGGQSVYIYRDEARVYIASDIGLFGEAGARPLKVDWKALDAYLRNPLVRTAQTCLGDVLELLPGHGSGFTPEGFTTYRLWSPWSYVGESHEHISTLTERLRNTVLACTAVWAKRYTNIAVTASGGLDSSIVAAALHASGSPATLLTMATDEAEGDERRYARLLATHLQFPLVEYHYALNDVDVGHSASSHLPRPTLPAIAQAEFGIKQRLVTREPVGIFFTGHGGDNVFCHLRNTLPVTDRFATRGPAGAMTTLLDIAAMTDCSLPEAISQISRRWLHGHRPRAASPSPFLRPSESGPIAAAPTNTPPGILPGKAAHVAMIERALATLDGFSNDVPGQVNPLLSQPIIEASLSIPTWRWCEGGQDRAIARQAFADRLPEALITRRSKGGPERLAFQILEANRTIIRTRLVHGELVAHGIVQGSAVDAVLTDPHPLPDWACIDLFRLVEAEVWARGWL